jgi:hypothetical protein
VRKRTDRNKSNDRRQKNNRREYGKETERIQQETVGAPWTDICWRIPNYLYETRLKLRVSGKKGDK